MTSAAVWCAAKALAANASARGGGLIDALQRLGADAKRARAILEVPEIQRAYGARDMWQLINQVAGSELGGAINVTRHRTLAEAGSSILQWLAEHADALNNPAVLAADVAVEDPALIDAVEQWLSSSGAVDSCAVPGGAPAGACRAVLRSRPVHRRDREEPRRHTQPR